MSRRARRPIPFLFSLLGVMLAASSVSAATIRVANNGLDSGQCGTASAPCRTITQAIENADNGDTILAGPGRYGNLDGDAVLGNTVGEENPSACGTPSTCVLAIEGKESLKIYSRDGAAATVIDGTGYPVQSLVRILAAGTQLGKVGKGFTITGATQGASVPSAVDIFLDIDFVSIAGNIVVANDGIGVTVLGSDAVIHDNRLIANRLGLYTDLFARRALVRDNAAINNTEDGFLIDAQGSTTDATVVTNNIATGNGLRGFWLSRVGTSGLVFTRNVAVGNREVGLVIERPIAPVHQNSLFGNLKCDLESFSEVTLDASDNYWGFSAGVVPASRICLSTLAVPVTTAPIHKTEIKVALSPIK